MATEAHGGGGAAASVPSPPIVSNKRAAAPDKHMRALKRYVQGLRISHRQDEEISHGLANHADGVAGMLGYDWTSQVPVHQPRDADRDKRAHVYTYSLRSDADILRLTTRSGKSWAQARPAVIAIKALLAYYNVITEAQIKKTLELLKRPELAAVLVQTYFVFLPTFHHLDQRPGLVCEVMEWLPEDLDEWANRLRGRVNDGHMTEVQFNREVFGVALQLSDAISLFHGLSYALCDLKPGNALVHPTGSHEGQTPYKVVLCDVITTARPFDARLDTHLGTRGFRAPEIEIEPLTGVFWRVRPEIDSYALGMSVRVMLSGEPAYRPPPSLSPPPPPPRAAPGHASVLQTSAATSTSMATPPLPPPPPTTGSQAIRMRYNYRVSLTGRQSAWLDDMLQPDPGRRPTPAGARALLLEPPAVTGRAQAASAAHVRVATAAAKLAAAQREFLVATGRLRYANAQLAKAKPPPGGKGTDAAAIATQPARGAKPMPPKPPKKKPNLQGIPLPPKPAAASRPPGNVATQPSSSARR